MFAAHYNQSGTFSQGDFNYDGAVNAADTSVLVANFDNTLSPTAASALPGSPPPVGAADYPFGRGFVLANNVISEHLASFLLISEHS
jgi:hypothetical protein